MPLTLLEHFKKCSDTPEAAQEAYAAHQEFVREKRALETTPVNELDEMETKAIELLVKFAGEN